MKVYVDGAVERAGIEDATAGVAVTGAGVVVVCVVVVAVVAGLGAAVVDV